MNGSHRRKFAELYPEDLEPWMSTQRMQISAKAGHYPHIAWIHDLENLYGDPDHPKNLISCSLHHWRAVIILFQSVAVHQLSYHWELISSKSAHQNPLMICHICQHGDPNQHQISSCVVPFTTMDPSKEFQRSLFITFLSNVLTDKLTNATENIVSLSEIKSMLQYQGCNCIVCCTFRDI